MKVLKNVFGSVCCNRSKFVAITKKRKKRNILNIVSS